MSTLVRLVNANPTLLPARWQMTVSLGSHIVLSCFGVAFPVMIWVVHGRGINNNNSNNNDNDVWLGLAKRWSKVAAVLFAIGAVSGTILSFEMGLLWPRFMRRFGDVIGLPFALEGIAFFIEAIFLGIYLYGWGRLPPRRHRAMLVPIGVSGLVGTFCILSVNAWMNNPTGFRVVDGNVTDVQPIAAMLNRGVWLQFLHMWIATFMVVGFVVASVYAEGIRRGRDGVHHRAGFLVPFAFASVAACIQPITGHLAGLRLATAQPSKLAAMELATRPETRAPLVIGGVLVNGRVRYAIRIPVLGSLVARSNPNARLPGLSQFSDDARPNDQLATTVHWSFQLMITCGFALLGLGAAFWWARRRGRDLLSSAWFLRLAVIAGPLAIAALELGWITTEVGRQPWIAYRVMRISDAVVQHNSVWVTFIVLSTVYAAMGVGALVVLRSMARRWREGDEIDLPTPYSPTSYSPTSNPPTSNSPTSSSPTSSVRI